MTETMGVPRRLRSQTSSSLSAARLSLPSRSGKSREFSMQSAFHRLSTGRSLARPRRGGHNCGKRPFYRRDRFVASLLNSQLRPPLGRWSFSIQMQRASEANGGLFSVVQFNIICQICPCLASLFRRFFFPLAAQSFASSPPRH